MLRKALILGMVLWAGTAGHAAPREEVSLVQRPWFAVQTAHFNLFSCSPSPDVYKLAGRLEQFCSAYAQLAGAKAVDSPPIIVLAFPDHAAMLPFLPLYQGKPANLAAFFQHGSDENLIALSLPESGSSYPDMAVIFHEYTHLLFRHNDRVWPLWMKEGMAEVYSTFQTAGHVARIGGPIQYHLQLLAHEPLMPLAELFEVKHDSAQYNEQSRQGMFYAESWLLTQFLMTGNNSQYRARFGQFTTLLNQDQLPVQAFTNALQASLPAVEAGLRRYLAGGVFAPIDLTLSADVSAPVASRTRTLTPVEVYFRLGDELLRIDRLDTAGLYFARAQALAPASPLPYEGLGLLANLRDEHGEALNNLGTAIELGSTSFLAYYIYAQEKYHTTADAHDRYARLKKAPATEIRTKLEQSIALMPDFGPAHQLLGFFEMVQGDNLVKAGLHLRRALELEPENPSYLFPLAQFQARTRNPAAARQTLEPLLRPNTDPKLRTEAEDMLKEINKQFPAR
jgi:tetratricopeptide (TPR) repeat protein